MVGPLHEGQHPPLPHGRVHQAFFDTLLIQQTKRIHFTLLVLSLAYFLFIVPELLMEFGLFDSYMPQSAPYYTLCVNSWYCTVLYCNVLYCTVLYCSILYCIVVEG